MRFAASELERNRFLDRIPEGDRTFFKEGYANMSQDLNTAWTAAKNAGGLGTAAGDAFTASLVVSLLDGRDREEALRRACAAGAIAASRFGAQPSLPTGDEVDAILRA